jgi:hypothetical protein
MKQGFILRGGKICLGFILFLILVTPAFAQGPPGGANLDLYDRIVEGLTPVVDFLDDYAALADGDVNTAAEDVWGAQLLSSDATGQGVPDTSPPGDYYADAPDEVREVGYTLESLSSRDTSAMSALDFAEWLGVAIALPFVFVRGLQDLASTMGPLGFFVSWLLLAAVWVGIVYFIVFLISFIRSLLQMGQTVLEALQLFKP